MSYLYHQAGKELELTEQSLASKEKGDEEPTNEGFIDVTDTTAFSGHSDDSRIVGLDHEEEDEPAQEEEEVEDEIEAV